MSVFIKALVSGIIFWGVIFAVISGLLTWYNSSDMAKIAIAIGIGVIAVLLADFLKPSNMNQALIYSFAWVIVGLILDWSITTRFNSQIFSSIYVWFGYALMFVSPIIYISLIKTKSVWKK